MKQLLLEPVDACDGVVTGAGAEGEETSDEELEHSPIVTVL